MPGQKLELKIVQLAVCVILLSICGGESLSVGGRFTRDTDADSGVNKTSDNSTFSTFSITAAPELNSSENTTNTATNNTTNNEGKVTDSEADKFIESLRNQANGSEPKNKNETHISSASPDGGVPSNTSGNATSSGESKNATSANNSTTTNADGSSITVISSNSTSMADEGSSQGHMFQNDNETKAEPLSNATANNNTTLNATNAETNANKSCPSDCSADSCKPECAFHCCLKESSKGANNSMAGFYQQDAKGNTSMGVAFDSSKLEKMLLDTISEFTQKLPNTQQQAQKLSEIMTDPSNHYAYAPSYDTNSNRYNFMGQLSNPYLANLNLNLNSNPSQIASPNMYLNGGAYANPNSYNYNLNRNYALKSRINPSYPYKRNRIPTPNYPMASTHHTKTNFINQNNPETNAYLYNNVYRRARIYTPKSESSRQL